MTSLMIYLEINSMQDDWISKTLDKNGVLINKKGITDEKELAKEEYRVSAKVALRILQRNLKIKSIDDLNKIHKAMFQSLYDWAGKERPGDFSKGNTVFFPHDRFIFAKEDINNVLAQPKYKGDEPLSNRDYAILLDKINFYHPFREGHGRSTKTFLQCLAQQHHQAIDYPRTNAELIQAQNDSDIDKIATLINVQNSPTLEAAQRQNLAIQKRIYLEQLRQQKSKKNT